MGGTASCGLPVVDQIREIVGSLIQAISFLDRYFLAYYIKPRGAGFF